MNEHLDYNRAPLPISAFFVIGALIGAVLIAGMGALWALLPPTPFFEVLP